MSLDYLFKPKSIAIVGASGDIQKTAGLPAHYLIKSGFTGNIFLVNPRYTELMGMRCYSSISEIPQAPDMAIILLGAKSSVTAVKELAEKGCKAAIVLASGFAELGEAGLELQQALLEARGTMRILGPNTIGLVNITDNIPLSASSALETGKIASGSVAIISQSGGIVGSLLSRSNAGGIGLSKLVATSNEADLDVADMVNYLVEDASTKIIVLYIEGLRSPEKFQKAAKRANLAGKPVIVFKIGRSEGGARSAASHTGAMAGEDRVYEQYFLQNRTIRAQTFADLVDLPVALGSQSIGSQVKERALHGKRIAILTSSGGAGTLIADNLGMLGFQTPLPDEMTAQQLRNLDKNLPIDLGNNPIDVTLAGLKPDLLRQIIAILVDSPSYDAIVVVVGSSALAMPDLMADAIGSVNQTKPIFAYISPYAPELTKRFIQRGIAAFQSPEGCAKGLAALWQISHWPDLMPELTSQTYERVALGAQNYQGTLNESESKALFKKFHIPVAHEKVILTAEDAVDFYRYSEQKVVLKILSADILHKTEVGGVAVGVSVSELSHSMALMKERVEKNTGKPITQFVIQEMETAELEMIVGVRKDILGMVLMVGAGGVRAEIDQDSAIYILPTEPFKTITREIILGMLQSLKIWPLLQGFRGSSQLDIEALISVIQQVAILAAQFRDNLLEAEINPLFVRKKNEGVVAVDGVVILNP